MKRKLWLIGLVLLVLLILIPASTALAVGENDPILTLTDLDTSGWWFKHIEDWQIEFIYISDEPAPVGENDLILTDLDTSGWWFKHIEDWQIEFNYPGEDLSILPETLFTEPVFDMQYDYGYYAWLFGLPPFYSPQA